VRVADIDDFDIDRSIAQAWAEFQARLSEIVSMIDDSADLTIGTGAASEDVAPYLRLSSPRPQLVRGEAASNSVLGPDFQLDAGQLATMERLGWQPPDTDNTPPEANFWFELSQDESDRISELAVAALRDVYGVKHPVFLAPDQLAEVLQPTPTPIESPPAVFDPGGKPPEPPAAGVAVPAPVEHGEATPTLPRSREHLNELVDAELARMFGHAPIRDAEGDVAIRIGSTMLFLRTSPDGAEVVIFAAVVHDVAGRSRAAEVLNDLNVEARWVKFQLVRDRVFVTVSVLARPFVPAHLRQAVQILAETADGIDDELAAKLNGRTTFSDHDEPH
jgi:hypothetical protein